VTKLIVKKDSLGLDSFVLLDGSHHQLYSTKSEGDLRNKVHKLYDTSENILAYIRKEIGENHVLLHIDMNETRIATITTNKGFSTKGFTIEPQGMKTKHNQSKLLFSVVKDNETVATVNINLFNFKSTYTIKMINSNDNELTYIMIALAIFIDERDPSFLGSIFKKIDWFQ